MWNQKKNIFYEVANLFHIQMIYVNFKMYENIS